MANQNNKQNKTRKLILGNWYTPGEVRVEPQEKQEVLVAGLAEAQIKKQFEGQYFSKAWRVFTGEYGNMFKAICWFVLFSIAFVLIITVAAPNYANAVLQDSYNFMGNIGIGYPGGGDSIPIATADLIWNVKLPVLGMLVLASMFAVLGAPGLFYVAKRLYFQDVYKKNMRTYWMGFVKYAWQFLVTSLFGVAICMAMGTAMLFLLKQQAIGPVGADAYCAVVFSFVFGLPLLLIPMVMQSIMVTYNLNFVQTFKNAIVIILNCPFAVILTGILSAAPLLICIAGNTAVIIIYLIMVFAGFALVPLMWTALGERCTDKCNYIKAEEDKANVKAQLRDRRQKSKASASTYQGNPTQKTNKPKQAPKPYQNPKKKKKQ